MSKSAYSEFLLKFLETTFLTCFMLESETAILWSDLGLFALQALTMYEDIDVDQTLDVTMKIICTQCITLYVNQPLVLLNCFCGFF